MKSVAFFFLIKKQNPNRNSLPNNSDKLQKFHSMLKEKS